MIVSSVSRGRVRKEEKIHILMASFPELKSGSYFDTPQPNGWKRPYEVHFPHNYVQYHPWGITPLKDTPRDNEDTSRDGEDTSRDSLVLPVSKVCHVTHEEQAIQISHLHGDGNYHFTPHKKPGKSYTEDGHSFGESYRCILSQTPDPRKRCYRYIPDTEPIFPGYYNWWGLAIHGHTGLYGIDLPPYLKSPPESVYGGYAFEAKFCDLLRLYATSRGCGDVYLKMGGTLRYKREIAYVVIICTANDLGALNSYRPITHAPPDVFDPNGLVDGYGKVVNLSRVPYFNTHFMNTSSSYETLDFAFYFSSPLADFQCPSNTIETHSVGHSFCIRKKPMATWYYPKIGEFETIWCCPDDESAKQTHANVTAFAMEKHGVSYEARVEVGMTIEEEEEEEEGESEEEEEEEESEEEDSEDEEEESEEEDEE